MTRQWTCFLSIFCMLAHGSDAAEPARAVRFNRDIRPILSENCYTCHGPDKNKRKSKLRLDTRDGLFGELDGRFAVVPGKADRSELLARVAAADASEKMPPPESGKSLSAGQAELLKRWIEEGAPWEGHWSYLPVERPQVPEGSGMENPIDLFIAARQKELGLQPAPEAERIDLIRRLSFDLLGLPPSPDAVDGFLREAGPESYERLCDAMLASPAFGERMAMAWLDLVRYADTTGIHGDNHRDVTPFRDYVIRAFNDNKPFDRFTIEQLAGDLLPDPTLEQKVASGYNRMNMTTSEGGAQAKEYIAKYAADRVRNASTVWLGSTLGCAECHNHKFDPFTARDFYSFAAFFADIQEGAVALPGPPFAVPAPDQEAEMAGLEAQLASIRKTLESSTPELEAAQAAWEAAIDHSSLGTVTLEPWMAVGPFPAASFDEAYAVSFGPEQGFDAAGKFLDGKLAWRPQPRWSDGKVHRLEGGAGATYLHRILKADRAFTLALSLGSDDSIQVWLNGKEALARKVQRAAAPDQELIKLQLQAGENRLLLKIVNAGADGGFYFKPQASDLPPKIAAILEKPGSGRSPAEAQELAVFYRGMAPLLKPARDRLAAVQKQKDQLDASIPKTLISMSGEPRTLRILPRGNWLDETGEIVRPAVPSFLKQLEVGNRRASRLDLAGWLVSRDNPLTARVFVNRIWKMAFGRGLATPLDDLGAQGTWPTHPELLDWLSADFRDSGWNVKALWKRILLSKTYRQSSFASGDLRQRDPYNHWLARQGRFRLDAEMIRDGALSISGMLITQVGGQSARPYQPSGYWDHLNFPRRVYEADHGGGLYRRGLYTYWCRTFLHPSLAAFDAPSREECTAERTRSNTPSQALVLLNDPTYVEAARVFAERILREGGGSVEDKVQWAFRRAVSRPASPAELRVIVDLYSGQLEEYRRDPSAAEKAVSAGEWPVAKDLAGAGKGAELAAWTAAARALLNLHETVTRL